jgi:threonine dehydratase
VYAPRLAPVTKLDAIRASGADLHLCSDYDEAEHRAKEAGRRNGAVFISAYSHPDVIAGAGTVALEILEDRPDVNRIVVPVGGGGLVSGTALVCDGRTDVWGVEVEASSPFAHGLAAGKIVQIEVRPTIADGLAGNLDPDTITFDLVRRLVRGLAVVCEAEVRAAVASLVLEERLVVEGAGAAGIAAVIDGRLEARGETIAVVVSGGNIDSELLKELL